MDRKLFKEIVKVYRDTCSIQDTANRFELSRSKVRKILITMHEITSPITESALPLLKEGKTQEEVAEILNISNATLSTYLPYSNRIFYKENRTLNALRCENYRARQEIAKKNQVAHNVSLNEEGDDYIMKETKGLVLKLELNTKYADMDVLRKYGNMKDGISRTFVVPVDMPLHNLHYAIQRAFGWQNSHLHHYQFTNEVFDEITRNKYSVWSHLCGVYFRFPSDDFQDWYWDDDYDDNQSPKSWLRKKYTRPYVYRGYQETYEYAQEQVQSMDEEISVGPSFEEYRKGIHTIKKIKTQDATMEEFSRSCTYGCNEIMERLGVGLIMDIAGESGLIYKYDYGDGWTIHITKIDKADSVKEVHCIAADGLNVLDDVGGVGGFCEFLKGIHGEAQNGPYDDPVGSRKWARYLGWTGRIVKPENML